MNVSAEEKREFRCIASKSLKLMADFPTVKGGTWDSSDGFLATPFDAHLMLI